MIVQSLHVTDVGSEPREGEREGNSHLRSSCGWHCACSYLCSGWGRWLSVKGKAGATHVAALMLPPGTTHIAPPPHSPMPIQARVQSSLPGGPAAMSYTSEAQCRADQRVPFPLGARPPTCSFLPIGEQPALPAQPCWGPSGWTARLRLCLLTSQDQDRSLRPAGRETRSHVGPWPVRLYSVHPLCRLHSRALLPHPQV